MQITDGVHGSHRRLPSHRCQTGEWSARGGFRVVGPILAELAAAHATRYQRTAGEISLLPRGRGCLPVLPANAAMPAANGHSYAASGARHKRAAGPAGRRAGPGNWWHRERPAASGSRHRRSDRRTLAAPPPGKPCDTMVPNRPRKGGHVSGAHSAGNHWRQRSGHGRRTSCPTADRCPP